MSPGAESVGFVIRRSWSVEEAFDLGMFIRARTMLLFVDSSKFCLECEWVLWSAWVFNKLLRAGKKNVQLFLEQRKLERQTAAFQSCFSKPHVPGIPERQGMCNTENHSRQTVSIVNNRLHSAMQFSLCAFVLGYVQIPQNTWILWRFEAELQYSES